MEFGDPTLKRPFGDEQKCAWKGLRATVVTEDVQFLQFTVFEGLSWPQHFIMKVFV